MEKGSLRNSAHDEQFFHVFTQYLDEALLKLKGQAGNEGDEDEYLSGQEEEPTE